MSWSVTLSGTKEAARASAAEQSDRNIGNGYQTEEQKALVLAAIDAAVGTYVSGSMGGHNNAENCSMSASIQGSTPAA